jgi:hypothetical protein
VSATALAPPTAPPKPPVPRPPPFEQRERAQTSLAYLYDGAPRTLSALATRRRGARAPWRRGPRARRRRAPGATQRVPTNLRPQGLFACADARAPAPRAAGSCRVCLSLVRLAPPPTPTRPLPPPPPTTHARARTKNHEAPRATHTMWRSHTPPLHTQVDMLRGRNGHQDIYFENIAAPSLTPRPTRASPRRRRWAQSTS